MPRASGWRWFSAWAIVGGLLFFSYLTGLSIGIFVLPFALLGLWLVTQVSRAWPELLGAASGAGLLCLGVAVANRDYEPCPDGPVMLLGESSFTCGGSEPLPWLLAGIVLAFTAPLATRSLDEHFVLREDSGVPAAAKTSRSAWAGPEVG